MYASSLPVIIQGGMGVAVSAWRLANAVARLGQLGVVSGTGIDQVLARRLQLGDADGALRSEIDRFPCRVTAERALARYFVPGGKDPVARFLTPPMFRVDSPKDHLAFAVLSSFVEVRLAREGHAGVVGINLLEKIPLPNPAVLYGAMLAGVDFVLMGAGIPWQVPGILDKLARHESATMKLALEDDLSGEGADLVFDPKAVFEIEMPPVVRPRFLAIVSFAVLAQALLKRSDGRIDGFVVEGPTAGGHNAPPRGAAKMNERGEPIYGERDVVDLEKMRALGLPFWLAGGKGSHECLVEALAAGAQGIQVGTAFAFCEESGLDPEIRTAVLERVATGELDVFTDPAASPTGFPFKVVRLPGTLSETAEYESRERVCDSGYLRRQFRKPDGSVGYRCAGEPVDTYVAKGGTAAEAEGRKCLCNALMANIGMGQVRDGEAELPLLTAGDDLLNLGERLGPRLEHYTARDVIESILGTAPGVAAEVAHQ